MKGKGSFDFSINFISESFKLVSYTGFHQSFSGFHQNTILPEQFRFSGIVV